MNRSIILKEAHRTARWLRKQAAFPRSYRECLAQAMRESYAVAREVARQEKARIALALEDEQFAAAHPDLVAQVKTLRESAAPFGVIIDLPKYDMAQRLYTIAREAWQEGRA